MLGFVALPRELIESDLFADSDLLRIFIWLLSRANYRDPRECFGVQVGAGQLIVGRRSMAEKLGLDPSKVDRALKKLASAKYQLIERNANRARTVVTICNFDRYRPKPKRRRTRIEPGSNQRRTTSEPESNQNRTQTNKNNNHNQEQEPKPPRIETRAERNEAPTPMRSDLDSARLDVVEVPNDESTEKRIIARYYEIEPFLSRKKRRDRADAVCLAVLDVMKILPEYALDDAMRFAEREKRKPDGANGIACIKGSLGKKLSFDRRSLRDEVARVRIPEKWRSFVENGPQPRAGEPTAAA